MILKCRLDNHSVSTTFSRQYIRSDVTPLSDGSENAGRHRVKVKLLNVRCIEIGLCKNCSVYLSDMPYVSRYSIKRV
jgi:hypothetical protein